MEEFLNFLANPTVQIIGWTFGGIGWIFGIISAWLQIKSYRQQNKMEQGYIAILEQAKQDWQGKYTQAQVDILNQELKRLEEAINKDIPIKARKVFLEDQMMALTHDLGQKYIRYNEIASEITAQGGILPDKLQKAIEKEIMPKYLEQQKQQKLILVFLGFLGIIFLTANMDIFLNYYFTGGLWLFIFGTICFCVILSYPSEKLANNILLRIGKGLGLYLGLSFLLIISLIFNFLLGELYSVIGSDFSLVALWMVSCAVSSFSVLVFYHAQKNPS